MTFSSIRLSDLFFCFTTYRWISVIILGLALSAISCAESKNKLDKDLATPENAKIIPSFIVQDYISKESDANYTIEVGKVNGIRFDLNQDGYSDWFVYEGLLGSSGCCGIVYLQEISREQPQRQNYCYAGHADYSILKTVKKNLRCSPKRVWLTKPKD